ncbi:MAG: hypothetical protein KatS3mg011_0914 [Acidimicrobiia bacterium]|jgi:CBS domain-containing protein|nr:MAG: hypothetical protein KatS3mg011_0914 [Acidimicrobiia bacterium]
MQVRELVGGSATVGGPDLTLEEAARVMIDEHIGSIGVVDGGKLVGILTDRDLVRAAAAGADPTSAKVREWMTPDPDRLSPDADVEEAAEWLLATGYRHLPVVDGDRLLGILSIKDLLWALEG